MFASLLTPEQRQAVQQAWRNLEAVVGALPSSAFTTLLSFHIRNLLDELEGTDGTDKVEIDISTVHTATNLVNALVEGEAFLSDMQNALARINQASHTLLYTE